MRNLTLAFLAVVLLSCQNGTQKGVEPQGVIFSADQTVQVGKWLTSSAWVPTRQQIKELEDKLPAYLESLQLNSAPEILSSLPSYRRQYMGIVEKDRRLIYVNLFCRDFFPNKDDWKTKFVWVPDGGPCFLQVYYDIEMGTFVRVTGNSIA